MTASAPTTRDTPGRPGARPSTSSSAISRVASVLAACLIVLAAGCGGDDEGGTTTAQTEQTTTTAPATSETSPATETEGETETEPSGTDTSGSGGAQPPGSGEDQEGGGGDEQGAHSQALLTGRGGRVTPPTVRVPPFISVHVVLRAADGQRYTVTIGGRTLRAGGAVGSASVKLDGLRAGKAYVGTVAGTGQRVRVEATAEPGP